MIEDTEYFADRKEMKELEYARIHEALNWTQTDPEQKFDAALGEVVFDHLSDVYANLEDLNPDLSKAEISARLPSISELLKGQNAGKLSKKAKRLMETFDDGLEAEQKKLLLAMDEGAVLEAIWFNVLIGNTDWALFGINQHSAGARNFKFFKTAEQVVYPVAYDFDLAQLASRAKIISKKDYQNFLIRIYKNLAEHFDRHLLDQASKSRFEFADRIDYLVAQGKLADNISESFQNFSRLLREIEPNSVK